VASTRVSPPTKMSCDVMLAKVAGKDTRTVVTALIKQAKKLPKELYKSLTWDRGKELTAHRRFTLATNIDVYFCDPQSPWQRGSNENTNGLLRQYFPQGTDLSVHSQAHLNKVARQLNERPRRPCNLKPQQRDLTPVSRRPVEPAEANRTLQMCKLTFDNQSLQVAEIDGSPGRCSRINFRQQHSA
jgi:hypothetical protein